MGSGVEEVSDGAGSTSAVVSDVVGCAIDKVLRDVVEVAAVVGVVAVDASEVANESFDIAKALTLWERWRVTSWFSVAAWLLA